MGWGCECWEVKRDLGGCHVTLPLSPRGTRLPGWIWSFLAGLSSEEHPPDIIFQRESSAYSVLCVHGKERHKQTRKVLVKPGWSRNVITETSYSSCGIINLMGSLKTLFLNIHTRMFSDDLEEFFIDFTGIVINSWGLNCHSIVATTVWVNKRTVFTRVLSTPRGPPLTAHWEHTWVIVAALKRTALFVLLWAFLVEADWRFIYELTARHLSRFFLLPLSRGAFWTGFTVVRKLFTGWWWSLLRPPLFPFYFGAICNKGNEVSKLVQAWELWSLLLGLCNGLDIVPPLLEHLEMDWRTLSEPQLVSLVKGLEGFSAIWFTC